MAAWPLCYAQSLHWLLPFQVAQLRQYRDCSNTAELSLLIYITGDVENVPHWSGYIPHNF
jgi:hypothetical protein